MDKKPDIDMFIGGHLIGSFSCPKVRLKKEGLFTRKLVFKKSEMFGLIDKILMSNNEQLLQSMMIVSSTNRSYTIEQFLNQLESCDEIK